MTGTKNIRNQGFTLLELLVVLAILVALIAILAPGIMARREEANKRTAKTQIEGFNQALQLYATDHGSYPTTEQGLNALIYIPSNEVTASGGQMTAMGQTNPMGTPGGMSGTDAFGNTAMSAGSELLGQGQGANPMGGGMNSMGNTTGMDPMGGGMNSMGNMTGMDPMGGGMNSMGNTTGMDPMGGGMNPMGGDPSMGGSMGQMGSMGGQSQPFHNQSLYQVLRKRENPYLDVDNIALDPWKRPYRYDNTIVNGVNPYTGERKPAIWSAGYDGEDGTEDDIRNWDPKIAEQLKASRQQQGMMGGGMGMGMDQMNMGGNMGMDQMNMGGGNMGMDQMNMGGNMGMDQMNNMNMQQMQQPQPPMQQPSMQQPTPQPPMQQPMPQPVMPQ